MKIVLDNIGRRFNRDWIFRGVNYTFDAGTSYAVLGPNGSGKSTFLQILASFLSPSSGKISFLRDGVAMDADTFFLQMSMATPYMELPEELTLREVIAFHFRFKKFRAGTDLAYILDLLGFTNALNKEVRYFSSGMKQRTKLALAFCSDTPILLLDEPTSNLDQHGVDWYLDLIKHHTEGRLVVIGSNQPHEYRFCDQQLLITDFKS